MVQFFSKIKYWERIGQTEILPFRILRNYMSGITL